MGGGTGNKAMFCLYTVQYTTMLFTLVQYLTQQLAKYWQKWVEFPSDALATVAKGGYYTIKIEEGLRLIAFNSDYGSVSTACMQKEK